MFQWAPVSVPILGADFLQHNDLSVNVRSKKVFSNSSSDGSAVDLPSSLPPSASPMQAAFLSTPQCVSDLHLDPAKLAAAKAEFSAMEKAGTIRHSTSPWASSLQMVKKKDGGRPCSDYCRLNTTTVPDRYQLPINAYFTSQVSGSTIFSKLDLQKG